MAMAPRDGTNTIENVFRATDFGEFIDSILEANTRGKNFVARITESRFASGPNATMEQHTVRNELAALESLLAMRRELDAHYGWVLASDTALIYKSMGGRSESGAVWARHWTRSVFEEYERIGKALRDVKSKLGSVESRCGM